MNGSSLCGVERASFFEVDSSGLRVTLFRGNSSVSCGLIDLETQQRGRVPLSRPVSKSFFEFRDVALKVFDPADRPRPHRIQRPHLIQRPHRTHRRIARGSCTLSSAFRRLFASYGIGLRASNFQWISAEFPPFYGLNRQGWVHSQESMRP